MEYLAHAIINGVYITSWGKDCPDAWLALIEIFGADTPVIVLACSITQIL